MLPSKLPVTQLCLLNKWTSDFLIELTKGLFAYLFSVLFFLGEHQGCHRMGGVLANRIPRLWTAAKNRHFGCILGQTHALRSLLCPPGPFPPPLENTAGIKDDTDSFWNVRFVGRLIRDLQLVRSPAGALSISLCFPWILPRGCPSWSHLALSGHDRWSHSLPPSSFLKAWGRVCLWLSSTLPPPPRALVSSVGVGHLLIYHLAQDKVCEVKLIS